MTEPHALRARSEQSFRLVVIRDVPCMMGPSKAGACVDVRVRQPGTQCLTRVGRERKAAEEEDVSLPPAEERRRSMNGPEEGASDAMSA